MPLVPPLAQEGHEGGLEVARAARERVWRAGEQQLPVGQDEHPLRVAVDLAEAARHGDRVLVLADGELLFGGTPSELATAVGPAKDFEAAFVQFLTERGH